MLLRDATSGNYSECEVHQARRLHRAGRTAELASLWALSRSLKIERLIDQNIGQRFYNSRACEADVKSGRKQTMVLVFSAACIDGQ